MTNEKQPKIRFKGFTDPWEQRKLGEVADIVGGGTPDSKITGYWHGDINWFTPTEIDGHHYVSDSRRKISSLGISNSSAKILPAGSVLLTSRATIGDMAIILKPSSTNQGFQSIRVKDNISNEFIYALNPYIKRYSLKHAAGSTFLEVSNHEIKKMDLFFPSFMEQKDIGGAFKLIDDLIAANQKKVDQLKRLKKLLMQKIFNQEWRFKGFTDPWEQRKLGELIDEYSKFAYGNCGFPIATSSRKGLFLQTDYFDGKRSGIDGSVKFHVLPEQFFTYRHMSDDSIFHFNINTFDTPLLVSKEYPVFKPVNSTDKFFIFYYLNHSDSFLKFSMLQKKGGTRTRLYFKVLVNFQLTLPNLLERQKIGFFLSSLNKLIAANQKKLDQLKQLKKYLMQNMFV